GDYLRRRFLRSTLLARFFFVFIEGNLFQIVGFENVVAIHTAHVVDPVTPHQEFRALMLTARHRMQIIPILMKALILSSPCYPLARAQNITFSFSGEWPRLRPEERRYRLSNPY